MTFAIRRRRYEEPAPLQLLQTFMHGLRSMTMPGINHEGLAVAISPGRLDLSMLVQSHSPAHDTG